MNEVLAAFYTLVVMILVLGADTSSAGPFAGFIVKVVTFIFFMSPLLIGMALGGKNE